MRSLPAGSFRMAIIENTPYKTATTPAPIASQSHVVATIGTPYKIKYLVVVQECQVRARHPERARTIAMRVVPANWNRTMTAQDSGYGVRPHFLEMGLTPLAHQGLKS